MPVSEGHRRNARRLTEEPMNDAWRWIILFVLAADYLSREGRGADLKHSVAFRVTFFAAVLIAIVLATFILVLAIEGRPALRLLHSN